MGAKRVYAHWEIQEPEHTMVMPVGTGAETVGDLLEAFAASYNDKHGRGLLDAPQLQVVSDRGNGYAPQAPLAALRAGQDLFVVPATDQASDSGGAAAPQGKLKANIAAKKENSYYYAHYATPDAPVPEPKKLATKAAVLDQSVTLENYLLDDGEKKVKIHVPLEGLSEMPEDCVVVHFREQSFDLRIYDNSGTIYSLNVPILHDKVVKEECKVLRKKDKVVLTLKKPPGAHAWDKLDKVWGLNEPRDSIVPNGGEPRTVMC